MANIEGSVNAGFLIPKEKPMGASGMCVEVMKRIASGGTIVIYGEDNTNAGSDDAQLINTFVGAIITAEAATGADSFYALSNTTTTNDTLTITSTNDVIYTIVAYGWAFKS